MLTVVCNLIDDATATLTFRRECVLNTADRNPPAVLPKIKHYASSFLIRRKAWWATNLLQALCKGEKIKSVFLLPCI